MKKMFSPSMYAISALLFGMSIPFVMAAGAPVTDAATQQQIAALSKKIDTLEASRYYLITYSKTGVNYARGLGNYVMTTVTPTSSVAECYGLIDHIENRSYIPIVQEFECVSSLDLKGIGEAEMKTK